MLETNQDNQNTKKQNRIIEHLWSDQYTTDLKSTQLLYLPFIVIDRSGKTV